MRVDAVEHLLAEHAAACARAAPGGSSASSAGASGSSPACGTIASRWRARSRGARAPGRCADVARVASSAQALRLSRCWAASVGEQQSRLAHREALDQAARNTSGGTASELAGGRAGAARRTARSVRAPRAGPAATRSPPRARRRGPACAGGRPGSRAPDRPGAARSAGARVRARPPPRPADRPAGASRRARPAPRRACRNATPAARDRRALAAGTVCDLRAGHSPRIRGARPRPGYALGVDMIDWATAQRIGEMVAGSPPPGRHQRSVGRAARPRLRSARERVQRPGRPGRAAAAGGGRPARVDRGQPAGACGRCSRR